MNFLPHQKTISLIGSKDIFAKQSEIAKALRQLPVSLLILHGSVAQDRCKALSDVDFAVLLKDDTYNLKNVMRVQEALCGILGREDVDLAVLNRASPLLCMQVLQNGKVIYATDEGVVARFRELTIRRYLQTKHLRKTFHEYQKQAVFEKG